MYALKCQGVEDLVDQFCKTAAKMIANNCKVICSKNSVGNIFKSQMRTKS